MSANIVKDLFKLVVPEEKCDPRFLYLRNLSQNETTRIMMNEVFQYFHDSDGNFVEQLQTTGFDARVFELYLFAYFWDGAYEITRDFDRPDFIIERDGIRVALEATTSNPTRGSVASTNKELTEEELQEKLMNELPIKLGSPLFSKVKKKYWELPQCSGLPFVLAIEPFHEEESLAYSSSFLVNYLYGQKDQVVVDQEGNKSLETTAILHHKSGEKIIPSNFFSLPDSENISAVIYTNAGTIAKFKRLGYHYGYFTHYFRMIRMGTCYDPDPNAFEPKNFNYRLEDRPIEPWGEGLVVCYNPNAKIPLPRDYFIEAAQYYVEDGKLYCDTPLFFPYSSTTLHLMDSEDSIPAPPKTVVAITKALVNEKVTRTETILFTELEWYMEKKTKRIGIILKDNNDNDFMVVLYKRTQRKYNLEKMEYNLNEINKARRLLFRLLL